MEKHSYVIEVTYRNWCVLERGLYGRLTLLVSLFCKSKVNDGRLQIG